VENARQIHTLCDGEVYFWIEQDSSIHLKALSGSSDPVEMTFVQARELGRRLIELADEGERHEVTEMPAE
jgi:hypothetical protein